MGAALGRATSTRLVSGNPGSLPFGQHVDDRQQRHRPHTCQYRRQNRRKRAAAPRCPRRPCCRRSGGGHLHIEPRRAKRRRIELRRLERRRHDPVCGNRRPGDGRRRNLRRSKRGCLHIDAGKRRPRRGRRWWRHPWHGSCLRQISRAATLASTTHDHGKFARARWCERKGRRRASSRLRRAMKQLRRPFKTAVAARGLRLGGGKRRRRYWPVPRSGNRLRHDWICRRWRCEVGRASNPFEQHRELSRRRGGRWRRCRPP